MSRRSLGAWLLVLGLVFATIGAILWVVENHRVHDHNNGQSAITHNMSEALFGNDPSGFTQTKANHAPSIVLWVLGGTSALFGMLLVAGTPGPASVATGSAPVDERLARLAQLHAEAALSDDEYEQAKRRVLDERNHLDERPRPDSDGCSEPPEGGGP